MNVTNSNTSASFIEWAINQHDVVCNQKYDEVLPYSMHLSFVVAQNLRFNHLIPPAIHRDVLMVCYGHDLIEDARVSYNDIKGRSNENVAEMILLLTTPPGRNREERHSHDYYNAIAGNTGATFVKVCDIIANANYSLLTRSGMFRKYKAEYPAIEQYLYRYELKPMFDHLEKLLSL